MKLFVDTDAFCKLGIAGLLPEAAALFGATLSESGRLPAVPYMLRKGRLFNRYGPDACSALVAQAQEMPVCPELPSASLEPFASNTAIDPGEVQLFAAAAQFNVVTISGDKRAIRSLKHATAVHHGLTGRIAALDGVLLALCGQLGPDALRRQVAPLSLYDRTVAVCFSPGSSDPGEGLRSYHDDLVADLHPFLLWNPETRRAT